MDAEPGTPEEDELDLLCRYCQKFYEKRGLLAKRLINVSFLWADT